MVVTVQALAQKLDDHLENCAAENIVTRKAITEMTAAIDEIKTLPIKAIRWMAGIIGTAVLTLAVQNFALHSETSKKADEAATQAAAANKAVMQIPAQTAAIVNSTKAP